MTLQDKVKDALDEGRILILGSQIIIGFQWHAVFEKGYESMSRFSQYLGIIALFTMLVLFGLLIAPACYHAIVAKGEDTHALHQFTTKSTEMALVPFATTLGIDLFLTSATLVGHRIAIMIGLAGLAVALFFWFGLAAFYAPKPITSASTMEKQEPTPLSVKIDHVLTEARMVLPGAQALLGFQFIIFFSDSFQRLPQLSKLLHLSSLLLVCFCVILLIAPAVFHRIVEGGEDTERFYQMANRLVLAAMVPLALASSLEFYIVAAKVTHNDRIAVAAASGLWIYFLILWFGYMVYLRKRS